MIKCGAVNQATRINITLYPPAETLYEVTTVWAGSIFIETFTLHCTNISEKTTVPISFSAGMTGTQNVTIIVRGYNDNYNGSSNIDDDNYEDYSPCYETKKPPNSDDVWALTFTYDDCYAKESSTSVASSSHSLIQNISDARNAVTRCFLSNFVPAMLLCIVAGIGFVLYILGTNEFQARTIRLNDAHDADYIDATMQWPSFFRHNNNSH